MFKHKKISVIIPCKNEEAALYSMLQNVPSVVDEVIVVDNGSTDNTVFVARTLGARVIKEKRNLEGVGYGYAHMSGIKHAKGDILIALDGDNTYPIEKIPEILTYMFKVNADFISCARFPLSNAKAISSLRQLGVRILNLETSILFNYHIKDILSGMWIMKRECAKRLNPKSGDWNFSPEIKLLALTNPEVHFSEYHISHAVRFNGVSKQNIWKTGFNHMEYILGLRLSYVRFKFPEVKVFSIANILTRQALAKLSF